MDECEALCSRLTIMVGGGLRCIGELLKIKDQYGQGYSVQIKIQLQATDDERKLLMTQIMTAFGASCELMDEHWALLQYRIVNPALSWATLFQTLETLKRANAVVESYTASGTTLEQIFIDFARGKHGL